MSEEGYVVKLKEARPVEVKGDDFFKTSCLILISEKT